MIVLGKVDLDNITSEDKELFGSVPLEPIYDMNSCSCFFGYNCDEETPLHARIVAYKKREL